MARPSLTLYRGFPTSAAYTWSPFVSKLETRFRFAGLTYKTEQGAPPKGPRGKIPYLAISKNGNSDPDMVSDSALISEKLVADGLAEDLNAKLTAPEKAQDLALRALLEDKLYFYQASPSISLSLDSSIPCRSRVGRESKRLTVALLTVRVTNVGSKITTRCGPKSSPGFRTPFRSLWGNLLIARCQRRSTVREQGASHRRRSQNLKQRSGRM